MTDGGAVPGVIEEAYFGQGCYTDIEQIAFNFNRRFELDTGGPESDSVQEQVIDLTELLDRREEMADLLYANVSLHIGATDQDDQVLATPRRAHVGAALNTGDAGPGTLQLIDPPPFNDGDETVVNTDRDVDNLGRRLVGMAEGTYEDGGNSAGGGGTSSDRDGWEAAGWQITSDPSFEERDDIVLNYYAEAGQGMTVYTSVSAIMLFGVYELEKQDVARC